MPKRPIESKEEIEKILREAPIGRLGTIVGDVPYIIPLGYAYDSGKIYFHSKFDGQKMAAIQREPKVSFEATQYQGVAQAAKPCKLSMRYRSVLAIGRARLVSDPDEKVRALQAMVDKYSERDDLEPVTRENADSVAVVEITIEEMTGKENVSLPPSA
ncbi:MAG: pyridoxamine 5'-phosphate oxidase family protein [Chloroflexi bacterium]|nr:pyridoxamine 5'-phosphate oxidase family protein [Chloroflexota bacterium]